MSGFYLLDLGKSAFRMSGHFGDWGPPSSFSRNHQAALALQYPVHRSPRNHDWVSVSPQLVTWWWSSVISNLGSFFLGSKASLWSSFCRMQLFETGYSRRVDLGIAQVSLLIGAISGAKSQWWAISSPFQNTEGKKDMRSVVYLPGWYTADKSWTHSHLIFLCSNEALAPASASSRLDRLPWVSSKSTTLRSLFKFQELRWLRKVVF